MNTCVHCGRQFIVTTVGGCICRRHVSFVWTYYAPCMDPNCIDNTAGCRGHAVAVVDPQRGPSVVLDE